MRRPAPAALLLAILACAGPRGRLPAPAEPSPAPPAALPRPPGISSYGGAEAPIALAPVEERAIALARARLGGGGAGPELSPALVRAARELATRDAAGEDATAPRALRGALARALAHDDGPSMRIQRASAADAPALLVETLARSKATHLGVGSAPAPDGGVVLVLLASERGARLDPFPRELAPGAAAVLSGTLRAGLSRPRVFMTDPAGKVQEKDVTGSGRAFRAGLVFPSRGRYRVEVLADGNPSVAALLTVSVGGAPLDPPAARPAADDPSDRGEAEARVVRAINATRRANGLPALEDAPAVAAVARAHSEAMLAAGQVAHVLAGSLEIGARLRRAGVPYRRAAENVARARTALEAHEMAEASPAHLANVLRRGPTRVGVGIARGALSTGDPIVYLTEIFVEAPDDGSGSTLTPAARVREALWAERARLGAPPLTQDARLDELAAEAVRAMRAADEPSRGDVGDRALAAGRRVAAVDVFVASGPDEATRSRNLPDARFRRVGVGVASGDSERFGAGRVWIAVVYTD